MSSVQSILSRVLPAAGSRHRETLRSFVVAGAAMLAVVAASCDKVPLTSPTGSTITLTTDKSIVPVNGQATITAVVTESSGTAVHNGTVVTFQPTLGRVDPAEAQTVNGRATAVYIAPSVSGTATINAYSGGATTGSGNSSSGGVQVRVGSAAVGSVALTVTPSAIPQNGGTVPLSALVLDSSGNALPSVAVLFSTDQGTLASSTVFSDPNGYAATTLTTNRVTKVAATVGSQKSPDFTINVNTAPTVTFSAITPSSPLVGSPIAVTLTPAVATTAAPIQSVLVEYGDGQTQQLGGITGPVGLTHTYSRAGGYTITATATDINGQRGVSSVALVVAEAALPVMTLSASPNPVPIANNGLTTITVGATAGAGAPPIRSVIVKLANGTVIYSGTGGGSFTYQFGTFQWGTTYTITATATDALGNTGTISSVVVVQ
ncbi:MAG: Ig-like domain-containing protein [Acidobacteriota bacterium]|nr:Ig-like domain-containing protein [Acidobacteriota bacterium]